MWTIKKISTCVHKKLFLKLFSTSIDKNVLYIQQIYCKLSYSKKIASNTKQRIKQISITNSTNVVSKW